MTLLGKKKEHYHRIEGLISPNVHATKFKPGCISNKDEEQK